MINTNYVFLLSEEARTKNIKNKNAMTQAQLADIQKTLHETERRLPAIDIIDSVREKWKNAPKRVL